MSVMGMKMSTLVEHQIVFIPQTQENAWSWETVQCSLSALLHFIYQHSHKTLEKLVLYQFALS